MPSYHQIKNLTLTAISPFSAQKSNNLFDENLCCNDSVKLNSYNIDC